MTDSQWSDDAPPPKKKGLPGWLWFCGAGCLLLAIVIAAFSYFGAKWVKSGMDSDVQWPKLQRILPFEEQPQNVDLVFGQKIPFQDAEMFLLMGHGLQGTIFRVGSGSQEEIAQIMDPDVSGGLFGMGSRQDMELVDMSIQGTMHPALHFYQSTPGQNSATGQALMLDLSGEDATTPVFLQLVRLPTFEESSDEEGDSGSSSKFTQDEVELFLSEFDL